MLSTAAGKASGIDQSSRDKRSSTALFSRKIWLPKLLYSALPFFYLASGVAAFLATVYINEWFWVLPHYLLCSVVCLHLGIFVYRKRYRKVEADSSHE